MTKDEEDSSRANSEPCNVATRILGTGMIERSKDNNHIQYKSDSEVRMRDVAQ